MNDVSSLQFFLFLVDIDIKKLLTHSISPIVIALEAKF